MTTSQAVLYERKAEVAWNWPSWKDPRIPFATILTVYAILGCTILGFNRSPGQILLTIAAGCALDMALAWLLRGQRLIPLSAYISSLSIALLLNYAHTCLLLFFPILMTVGSKYVFTFKGKHVYNPSLFGVATSLLLANEFITAAPAYQWGGTVAMSCFIIMAAVCLFVFRVGRTPLIASFLIFYAIQTGVRAWIMRHHLPPETLFFGTLTSAPFFLFTFYMITDPATSPKTTKGQIVLAFFLALVDLYLHKFESVFTFFYAAFIVATVKFLFLHVREVFRTGAFAYLRATLFTWPRIGTLTLLVGSGAAAHQLILSPASIDTPVNFRLELVQDTGIHSEMGDTLDLVDPRLQHIAKWLLSVGDAVAVGDFDNDGLVDLFFTNTLKRAEDRNSLYRNLGNFKFERVRIPALERYSADPKTYGVSTGAVFFDYDHDGLLDLLVLFMCGKPRLFHNEGHGKFTEVEVGLDDLCISFSAAVFDFDRDGKLDLLIGNAANPYLPDYAVPTPLNIFNLPQPEYPGDRRMFRFMHNGWHNADNGGLNVLYRNVGGRFEKLDAAAMGMPETHWTIAIGTGDLNNDGWTDLYCASDFGPDDLYLNKQGHGFERVQGRYFGEIGRDTYKGMNATIADFDRNGHMDIYVSNVHHALQAEGSLLWMTRPTKDPFHPSFTDEAMSRGALNERRFGWGAAAGDLNNDGWIDIVQANGMVDDRLDHRFEGNKDYWYVNHKLMQAPPEIHMYADAWGDLRGRVIYPNEKRRVYLNTGGRFVDVAGCVGLTEGDNSRGVALVDLDNDGDLDVVITNQHGPVSIYRNTLDGRAHWIGLQLEGNGCSAVGSRVRLDYGGQTQYLEVQVVNGFSAQNDPRLHAGLGDYSGPVDVTVTWYVSGATRTYRLDADRYHRIREE